jgi:hypothetical protein
MCTSFLYGCGTWSLTLNEENILRMLENRVLMRIFGPEREAAEDYIMRSFIMYTLHLILLR